MSISLQSYSSYPEGKRAPSLNAITRTFFAQTLSGSLHRVRRKTRSVFSGNRHKQSPLPFEFHFQWSRSNGDGAFFPTNLERHPRLDAGLTANVFRNHQSSRMLNGGFHGTESTMANTVCPAKPPGVIVHAYAAFNEKDTAKGGDRKRVPAVQAVRTVRAV